MINELNSFKNQLDINHKLSLECDDLKRRFELINADYTILKDKYQLLAEHHKLKKNKYKTILNDKKTNLQLLNEKCCKNKLEYDNELKDLHSKYRKEIELIVNSNKNDIDKMNRIIQESNKDKYNLESNLNLKINELQKTIEERDISKKLN